MRPDIFAVQTGFDLSNFSDHMFVSLWKQVQQGDPTAFERLYQACVLLLSNQAYRIVKDEDVVKDILQDVFVSLYIKRQELPEDLNVVGYLSNAVKYKVSSFLRDQLSKEPHHQTLLYRQQQAELFQPNHYENKVLQQQIAAGINALPEKCRQAFMLNHYERLSYKAIAQEMGISVKTVEKHISKALQVLRRELSEGVHISVIAVIALYLL